MNSRTARGSRRPNTSNAVELLTAALALAGKVVRLLTAALVLAVMVACAPAAHAHTMYLYVTDYVPNLEWGNKMYFGWGHHVPIDDHLGAEWLAKCQMVSPDGSTEDMEIPEEFLTRVAFPEPGTYVLASELKGGFYTMHMKDGEMQHVIAPKTGLENVVVSMYYEQYAKAIVNAGAMTDGFSKPLGHKMELVPLKNPATLRAGDYLPVQVLFEGKPISGYPSINATYIGFSNEDAFAYTTSVSHGQAMIKILQDGVWIVKVDLQKPPTEELADKCDALHYTATLTFETGREPEAPRQ